MLLALTTAAWLRLGGLIVGVWAVLMVLGTYDERKEAVEKGEREDLGFVAPLAWPRKMVRAAYERSKIVQWLSVGVVTVVVWIIAVAVVVVALWLAINLVGYIFAPDPCSAESDGQASCPQYEWWP
jgi:small neutral amino acid transporter SnatA (MarC family)